MKGLICGLMCAGVFCIGVSVARGEGTAIPAAPEEIVQLKEKAKVIEKKLAEIRGKVAATDEVKALRQKADEAQKAVNDARKAKQDAEPKYAAGKKTASDAEAKLNGMGLKMDGLPKDATKVLSDAEKADAEAAAKARKEARDQVAAIEKEINSSEEIKKLEQASKDAGKSINAAMKAKLDADPDYAALEKDRDELNAKLKAAKEAAQKEAAPKK